ncbi:hypothetical protein [Nonomuraea angiospora]|uniref:hypothetical protein n=1 Tax=Nonomuraea angiospora TaxID=46172 RepID=UPI003F571539
MRGRLDAWPITEPLGPRVGVDLRKQLQQFAVEPEDPFDFFGEVLMTSVVAPLDVRPDHALAVSDLRGQALVGQLLLQTTRLHAGPKADPAGEEVEP